MGGHTDFVYVHQVFRLVAVTWQARQGTRKVSKEWLLWNSFFIAVPKIYFIVLRFQFSNLYVFKWQSFSLKLFWIKFYLCSPWARTRGQMMLVLNPALLLRSYAFANQWQRSFQHTHTQTDGFKRFPCAKYLDVSIFKIHAMMRSVVETGDEIPNFFKTDGNQTQSLGWLRMHIWRDMLPN